MALGPNGGVIGKCNAAGSACTTCQSTKITTTGTFNAQAGQATVDVLVVSGGGSGASDGAGGGGGGGTLLISCHPLTNLGLAVPVTIGAGGATPCCSGTPPHGGFPGSSTHFGTACGTDVISTTGGGGGGTPGPTAPIPAGYAPSGGSGGGAGWIPPGNAAPTPAG